MKADWHVHSCLSPCASLDMSPDRIAREAAARGLDMVALTDHNSARNAPAFAACCRRHGVLPLFGLEAVTSEECHVLALFDNLAAAAEMDAWVSAALPPVPLDAERFGDQPVVDEHGVILEQIEILLLSATGRSLEETGRRTRELGGLFIPSHIDRPSFSIESQIGFLPPGPYDALEVSPAHAGAYRTRYPDHPVIVSSDAHVPEAIGSAFFDLAADGPAVSELRAALRQRRLRIHT